MKLKAMARAVAFACELIGWEWRTRQAEAMDAAASSQSDPKISAATTT